MLAEPESKMNVISEYSSVCYTIYLIKKSLRYFIIPYHQRPHHNPVTDTNTVLLLSFQRLGLQDVPQFRAAQP